MQYKPDSQIKNYLKKVTYINYVDIANEKSIKILTYLDGTPI